MSRGEKSVLIPYLSTRKFRNKVMWDAFIERSDVLLLQKVTAGNSTSLIE